jgi:hypothetical protein
MEIEMSVVRIALLLLLSSPAIAEEQTMAVGSGVLCDTPQQAERFATLRSDGKDTEVALQAVNNEISGACGFGLVIFTESVLVAQLSVNGRPVSVVKITVHAINHGSTWKEVPDLVRYTVVVEKGRVA